MKKFSRSFLYAYEGIKYTFKTQRNIKIQLVIMIIIIILSIYFDISKTEWLILLLTICAVISLEIINTAIEAVVDLVTNDFNPIAKRAKDAAAGAVLISTITAFIIGCIIFLPKII